MTLRKGWQIKKLGEVCNIVGGGTPDKSNHKFYEGHIPWATVRDMKTELLEATEYTITEDAVNRSSTNIIPKNNVIIATRVGLGKVCYLINDTAINQDLRGVIPKDKNLLVPFLFYWFKSIAKQIVDAGTGATVHGVKLPFVKALEIPIPPLPEQQRIVEILDEAFTGIDAAIANTERAIANSKELFDSELNHIFSQRGEGWEVKTLGEIAEYFNGLTYSPKDVTDTGTVVLRSSNIQSDDLDFSDIVRVSVNIKEKLYVKDGDILMCSRNGSKRLVGKTALIANLDEPMTFGTFMMIVRSEYNPYLLYFFKSKIFKKQISGGENTMINQVTRYMLDEITVIIPLLTEQQRIVAKLDQLKDQTQALEAVYQQKLAALQELKQSLLHKAFTGELTAQWQGEA